MPDGERLRFKVRDEVRRPQSDLPGKILLLELVEFDDGRRETRLGYYVIGKKPRRLGKWVWGQYAPFMPLEDLKALVSCAVERGWDKVIREGTPRREVKQ
jgi:hypothetical protein